MATGTHDILPKLGKRDWRFSDLCVHIVATLTHGCSELTGPIRPGDHLSKHFKVIEANPEIIKRGTIILRQDQPVPSYIAYADHDAREVAHILQMPEIFQHPEGNRSLGDSPYLTLEYTGSTMDVLFTQNQVDLITRYPESKLAKLVLREAGVPVSDKVTSLSGCVNAIKEVYPTPLDALFVRMRPNTNEIEISEGPRNNGLMRLDRILALRYIPWYEDNAGPAYVFTGTEIPPLGEEATPLDFPDLPRLEDIQLTPIFVEQNYTISGVEYLEHQVGTARFSRNLLYRQDSITIPEEILAQGATAIFDYIQETLLEEFEDEEHDLSLRDINPSDTEVIMASFNGRRIFNSWRSGLSEEDRDRLGVVE